MDGERDRDGADGTSRGLGALLKYRRQGLGIIMIIEANADLIDPFVPTSGTKNHWSHKRPPAEHGRREGAVVAQTRHTDWNSHCTGLESPGCFLLTGSPWAPWCWNCLCDITYRTRD